MMDKIETMSGFTKTLTTSKRNMQHYINRIFFTLSFFIVAVSSQAQYSQPDVSFSIEGACIHDSIQFNPQVLGLDTLLMDSLTQAIWNFGDGTVDTITLFPTAITVAGINHIYIGSGIFYPSLTVINRDQFDSTFTKRIVISPKVNLNAGTPYYESFSTGKNGWNAEIAETSIGSGIANDSLWQWGTAIGTNINTTMSNNKIWGTRTASPPTTYLQGEEGWVYSPCFDLSQLDRPMISLDIWRNMVTGIDGTVLEYYDVINGTWNVLGEAYNYGIGWYKDSFLLSRPGAQANEPYPVGWTGQGATWENARYALDHPNDDLRNQTNVRFRIAFASDPNTLVGTYDGFAFDNVFIGNRTQNTVVEHFSGVGYPGIEAIETNLYQMLDQYPYREDISLIQYHTNTYSNDAFYNYNPVVSNTRMYFYGTSDANKALVNGLNLTNYTSDLNPELLSKNALKSPKFEINFGSVPFIYTTTNSLHADVVVQALEDLPLNQYIIHVIITEDSLLTVTGHLTKAVSRELVDNSNIYYQKAWIAGETIVNTLNVPVNTVLNFNNLRLTAFIQNASTKEIYQVTNQALFASNRLPNYLGVVAGTVALDTNNNCLSDSLEMGLYGKMVEIQGNGRTYTTSTDSLGEFDAIIDTGMYALSVTNLNPYRVSCLASSAVYVSGVGIDTLDLLVRDSLLCPYLTVDISAPFLRSTGGGSYYTVQYCNQGTMTAASSFVDVNIDPNLIVQGSSIPYTNLSGSIYRFNLGDLVAETCGSFSIHVLVPPTLPVGQTLCTEAHIFPDTICLANLWAGAIVNTSGTCIGDTIYFSIQNTGAAMGAYQHYYVVEDNIMMRTDSFLLGSGQTQDITIAAGVGHTYRIIAEQENGYPPILGDATATTVIEACLLRPDDSFNTGYVTQFSNGNSAPFIAVDCQQTVASYDPNDKIGYPVGFGAAHNIAQNIALDYRVRFQNTGTDTAFNIVIIDTISTHLDLNSLEMGASSHAYTWELSGRELTMHFKDILLVDSNANEPLSHGFIRYRMNQKVDNPIGTTINNQAAIYFDFNPPIFTNITEHTIGENIAVLDVSIDKTLEENLSIKIYPNPFDAMTTIEVSGKEYPNLELLIFDALGRLVETVKSRETNRIQLLRGKMRAGIYYYQLKGNDKLIGTGKIVVQ
jgi:hypothetical protein